jgi:hypothetical protein
MTLLSMVNLSVIVLIVLDCVLAPAENSITARGCDPVGSVLISEYSMVVVAIVENILHAYCQ